MMKRRVLWVVLIALVLCFSVTFLTGCSKQAGLKSDAVVTQEQKPAAQSAAVAADDQAAAKAKAARTQQMSEQDAGDAARAAAAKAAADKAAADKAAAAKAAADKAAKDKAAADKAAAAKAAAILEELQIQDVRFDFDKYDLRPDGRAILMVRAPAYLKYTDYKLVVEGHCDERGTVEYNLALGQKRADEAAKYLVDLGIQKDRIKTISYGKEMPMDKGHDEAAWTKNRRAHFVVFPPAPK
jgi:peptidoglycan-associated lipoprotein